MVIGVSLCPLFPFCLLAASVRLHVAVSHPWRCCEEHEHRILDVQYGVSSDPGSSIRSSGLAYVINHVPSVRTYARRGADIRLSSVCSSSRRRR